MKNWVEVIGVISVIASLIFVGMEVRQNTAAIRGSTYQSIADASQEHTLSYAQNDKLLKLWARVYDEGAVQSDFTAEERRKINAEYVVTIRRIENVYVQVREGLVESEAVLRFRPAADYFTTPYFQSFWKDWREQLEPEFAEYFQIEFIR